MSRFELQKHPCAGCEQDHEVVCHGCGVTALKSDIVSGAHAKSCSVRACLVMPVITPGFLQDRSGNSSLRSNFSEPRLSLLRCGQTFFESPWNLCAELERFKVSNEEMSEQCEKRLAETINRLKHSMFPTS
jgi:hypothetical protein